MWLLLGQSDRITSWLTPVWMLMTGIAIGFVFVLALWALLLALSRVPWVNRIYEKNGLRLAVGLGLAAAFFGLLYWYTSSMGYWTRGDMEPDKWRSHLFLMVLYYGGGCLLTGFGLLAAVSEKRRDDIQHSMTTGFLYWTSIVCVSAALFSVLGYGLAKAEGFGILIPVDEPEMLLRSAAQLPGTGESRTEISLPNPTPPGGYLVSEAALNGWQLTWMRVRSNQPVDIASQPITDELSQLQLLDIAQNDDYIVYVRGPEDKRFPDEFIPQLYIANRGTGPAVLTLVWQTAPRYPEAYLFYWAAGSVVFLYLAYFMFTAAFPKIYAVAHSTFKTEVSQPVFLILFIIGIVFVVGSVYIPYNTFGEDIKMYKDSGLTLIRVLGIFLAVWAASKSLAEEIEGRTALTVLSKPISRRQFILGKYSGIGMTIALLFILVGIWFIIWVSYKPIYDSQESTIRDFSWENCFREATNTIPGLVLAWLEAMVFAAISVVISTRLGILANFMICFSIYVLGHLTPLIVQSAEVAQSFEGVVVFGQVISIIFPVLDHFDINAAITGNVTVPISYLGWSTVYCGLYGLIALLLALVLFEDRDLA